jgi:hypothetical protein
MTSLVAFWKRLFSILLLLTFLFLPAFASKKKIVPPAPLPSAITDAKKVFVTNAGGNQLTFDEFYAQIKQWGRYQIVGSPADADIILELRYFVEDKGTRVSTATNTYTGHTQVFTHEIIDPQLSLNIYSAGTKDLLWSVTDHKRLARLEKNREKETINSADRLMQDLRARIEIATP